MAVVVVVQVKTCSSSSQRHTFVRSFVRTQVALLQARRLSPHTYAASDDEATHSLVKVGGGLGKFFVLLKHVSHECRSFVQRRRIFGEMWREKRVLIQANFVLPLLPIQRWPT